MYVHMCVFLYTYIYICVCMCIYMYYDLICFIGRVDKNGFSGCGVVDSPR